jgi:GNAT superfamily N-acetyltransferase
VSLKNFQYSVSASRRGVVPFQWVRTVCYLTRRDDEMRRAARDDIPLLVDLMAEFYAEAGYALNHAHAGEAFAALLADEGLGSVWIIQAEHQDVGHMVLTLRYAMEYGGLIACLDDLYVKQEWRNRGLATHALMEARTFCEKAGIRALTVEVGEDNGAAQTVYRRAGFAEAIGRELLALPLAPPTHL